MFFMTQNKARLIGQLWSTSLKKLVAILGNQDSVLFYHLLSISTDFW